MFKNTYQNRLLSIFYSCGANPLSIWDMEVSNGHIKRVTDNEVNSIVLEIVGTNVATTYITCPKNPSQILGIKLPFLVMVVKNLKRYFSFEITVLDDTNMRRRFRISNFQSTTKIKPFCTTMPIGLARGWNQIQFNLADFTKRAYGTQFIETLRVQVHANARLRRIYFSDRLYSEEELPQDYKLYLPLERKQKKKLEKKEVAPVKSAMSKKTMAMASPVGDKEQQAPSEAAGDASQPAPTAPTSSGGEAVPSAEEAAAQEETTSPKDVKTESEATEGTATAEQKSEAETKSVSEAPTEGDVAPSKEEEAVAGEASSEVPAEAPDEAPAAEEAAADQPANEAEQATEGEPANEADTAVQADQPPTVEIESTEA